MHRSPKILDAKERKTRFSTWSLFDNEIIPSDGIEKQIGSLYMATIFTTKSTVDRDTEQC